MKAKNKVTIEWSAKFAYAIGLITTDGCLYSDGRHISLVSKDREQLENFLPCLGITSSIGESKSGLGRSYLRIQLGDVNFYRFLLSIGLMPNKSKILNKIDIPEKYFFDFLRGHFDGDGTFYSYWDPRWRSSYLFYTVFASASKQHVVWLREKIQSLLGISGHLTKATVHNAVYQLKYAKRDSLVLLSHLYYDENVVCLTRKKEKILSALQLKNISIRAGGETR